MSFVLFQGQHMTTLPLLLFGGAAILSGAIIFTLPETKGIWIRIHI